MEFALPDGFDPDEETLLRRIGRSNRCGSARVHAGDPRVVAAADRLVAIGWADVWDDGDLRGRRATLTVAAAATLGAMLAGDPARWVRAGGPCPKARPADSGLIVYATDINKSWNTYHEAAIDATATPWGRPNDGKHRRPSVLIGSSTVWRPEKDGEPCQACGGRIHAGSHYCIRCDRAFLDGDKPLRANILSARGKAAARPRRNSA